MKKNIFIILMLLVIIFQDGLSQDKNGSELYIELGYFVPSKESYRNNYQPCLFFIGDYNLPIALGMGFQYGISNNKALFFQSKLLRNQLESDRETSIVTIPLIFGFRYYLPLDKIDDSNTKIFIGAGAGYYFTFFASKYFRTAVTGEVLGEYVDVLNYNGVGINLESGMEYLLSKRTSISFVINYDITRNSKTETGGLGNIGGLLFSGRLSFNL